MFEDKGAYHKIERKLYNVTYARHRMVPSQAALDALHVIQETPWEINEEVMKFIDWLNTTGKNSPMGFAFKSKPKSKLSQVEWSDLSKKQKRDIYEEKKKHMSANGKRSAIAARIRIANEIRYSGEFYQPQFFCFRGRIYPMNTEFNNQADHYSKGMMRFKRGRALGESGLRQLKIHIANTWGQDKLQLEDREAYVNDRLDHLHMIASDYTYASTHCAKGKTDEPMAFYAAVLELSKALKSGDPRSFISRVPGAVDGTCNGLQILSLLAHDPIGADKTNCTSNPTRQDVYMEVADIAMALVDDDVESDVEFDTLDADGEPTKISAVVLADIWREHLKDVNSRRKAVKRAIMTTAYGVSEFSMGKNLLADGIIDALIIPEGLFDKYSENKLKGLLAAYFRDKIVEARKGAINHAVQIMDYFTHVAKTLGENNVDMSWTVPDGLHVVQSYRQTEVTRYDSADVGRLSIKKITEQRNIKKQGSGAAPQVVHSLDAAMLRMTSVEMVKRGYPDLCMIHDSYGTHMGAIEELHTVLREVAVDIFSGNWLRDNFHAEQLQHGVELMEPPTQGTLDVAQEIPKSSYFFS